MNIRGVVLGLCATAVSAVPGPGAVRTAETAVAHAAPPRTLPLQESLEKARVDGKYAMLLQQIKVEDDWKEYGAFRDRGQSPAQAEYHGRKDVPAGFWVYVYPYWYIWRDETAKPIAKRAWGPEQATGEPDTQGPGDVQTAWASQTQDGQDEWLTLEYAEPVLPSAVLVYETFNPGAVYRVTAFRLNGEEVEVWKGKDPTRPEAGVGVSEIPVEAPFKTNRVKLYIDSKAVAGWNEIDAVGLRDSSGQTHWATAADASSTYAEQGGAFFAGGVVIAVPAPGPAPIAPAGALPSSDRRPPVVHRRRRRPPCHRTGAAPGHRAGARASAGRRPARAQPAGGCRREGQEDREAPGGNPGFEGAVKEAGGAAGQGEVKVCSGRAGNPAPTAVFR